MGRREAALQAAVQSLRAEGLDVEGVIGDVRKQEDCKKVADAAVQKYGRLDILVNSAAGNFLATAEDLSPNGFKTVMDIDAAGVFNMSSASFPHLKSSKGLIVNISATLHYGATWFQIHSSAAKAAIDSMTRSFALEWGEYGIRVTGIAPGGILGTAGLSKLSGEHSMDKMNKVVPLGRLGTKWDIAMSVLYLASSAGNYISGEIIVVDGAAWVYREPAVSRQLVKSYSRQVEGTSRQSGLASPAPKPSRSKL